VTEFEPGLLGEIAKAGLTLALRAIVCGELGASSVIMTNAALRPITTGENDTPTVHVAPTAYAAAVQLFVTLKALAFVPLRATDVMCSDPVPEFVRVTTCPLTAAPCVTVPNEMLVGVNFATGVPGGGAAPVPVNCTDCGESGASSLMVIVAVRCPAAWGANVTTMSQVAPAGYAPEQPLATWKSAAFAPPGRTDDICSGAGPMLLTVMVCAVLVLPCIVLAKMRLPGAKLTADTGDTPRPLRGINCGLPGALSVADKLACRVPAAVGEKIRLTVQVAFGARTVGREQFGVAKKSAGLEPVTLRDARLSA
jgi:hypothetical protein